METLGNPYRTQVLKLQQALAEKNAEITVLKNEVDLHQMLSMDSKRYDMLMAQAVKFATYYNMA